MSDAEATPNVRDRRATRQLERNVTSTAELRTEVLELDGLRYASQKNVVESALGRRPGVVEVEANPATLTASVTFDAAAVSLEDLQEWISDCGFHCAGLLGAGPHLRSDDW